MSMSGEKLCPLCDRPMGQHPFEDCFVAPPIEGVPEAVLAGTCECDLGECTCPRPTTEGGGSDEEAAIERVAAALWTKATEQEIERTGTDFNVAHIRYEDAEEWRKVWVRGQAQAAIAALSAQPRPTKGVGGDGKEAAEKAWNAWFDARPHGSLVTPLPITQVSDLAKVMFDAGCVFARATEGAREGERRLAREAAAAAIRRAEERLQPAENPFALPPVQT